MLLWYKSLLHNEAGEELMGRTIELPDDLYERARAWIERNGGFSSVEELVSFLIEEFISEDEDVDYSEEEEEEIKERLRKLGYL